MDRGRDHLRRTGHRGGDRSLRTTLGRARLRVVRRRDPGDQELAGFTGLNTPNSWPEILPAVEIGWRLGRQHWGRGIATEAARAALNFGFTDRGLDRVLSICRTGNDASENIMRKLGMHLDRDTTAPTGYPVRVYALRGTYRHEHDS